MISHIPVLANEILQMFDPKEGEIFIDCTLGTGGHAEELLKKLAGQGAVYGIEVDDRNLYLAQKRLADYKNIHFIRDNFENLESLGDRILKEEGRINGILFDLGLSSLHIDEAERGFSFQKEGPLDMRFDARQNLTAGEIINTYPFEKLLFIFRTYGEERFSHRIAQNIVGFRRKKKFETTSELADFISKFLPKKWRAGRRMHPATRVFQALRIAANREIEVLEKGLESAIKIISKGGKIAVISYHSLEDRVVKNIFRNKRKDGILTVLTKKPIRPLENEIRENPRSRSARLRVASKN